MDEALTFQDFIADGEDYMASCIQELLAGGFPISWEPDHLVYFCASPEEHLAVLQLLEPLRPPMLDHSSDGQQVRVFALETPFIVRGYDVAVLKVFGPDNSRSRTSGFGRFGIVPTDRLGVDEFAARISKSIFDVKRAYPEGDEKAYDVHLVEQFPEGPRRELQVRVTGLSLYDLLETSDEVRQFEFA